MHVLLPPSSPCPLPLCSCPQAWLAALAVEAGSHAPLSAVAGEGRCLTSLMLKGLKLLVQLPLYPCVLCAIGVSNAYILPSLGKISHALRPPSHTGVLERAVACEAVQHCPLLWRCYARLEAGRGRPEAVRRWGGAGS